MPLQPNPLQLLSQQFAGPSIRKPARTVLSNGMMGTANDPAELYNFQQALGDELAASQINAQAFGDTPNATRFAGFGALNRQNMAQSPIPQQGVELAQWGAENRQALNEGFGPMNTDTPDPNPIVSRNLFKRKFEQDKMRQPITLKEMEERGAMQRVKEQGNAQRDVAKTAGEYDVERAEIAAQPQIRYNELQEMLINRQGAGGGAPIRSIGKTSMSFQNPPNTTSSDNQMVVIRQNLERAGGQAWINEASGNPQQRAYNAAVSNEIARTPIAPDAKQTIINIMRTPADASKPLNELFEVDQLTPQEYNVLMNLFLKIRGF